MTNDLVSIIIRAKNEEEWIGRTLSAIAKQTYQTFEIILVDNESTDRTVEIAKKFPCKIISFSGTYAPGKALNHGIRESTGSLLVLLSAHTVPVDVFWLENLVNAAKEHNTSAGIYGRQLPMPDSLPYNKRDLIITFGPEKKIQYKDHFFHNANSMIRRAVWDQFPFDEFVTNIEDRLWAKTVQEAGWSIVYEPTAQVFHHHGIHQYGNTGRCETTVKILEDIESPGITRDLLDRQLLNSQETNVLAIIPISQDDAKRILEVPDGSNQSFLEHILQETKRSSLLNEIIIATDDKTIIETAQTHGIWTFFYKTPTFDGPQASLDEVLRASLQYAKDTYNYDPTYTLFLKSTHVFRTAELIDDLIKKICIEKEDSVFVAKQEYRACWALEQGKFIRKDEGFIKRSEKSPLWIGYSGLGCITKTDFIHAGCRLGDSVAIIHINNTLTLLDIQDESELAIAKKMFATRFPL